MKFDLYYHGKLKWYALSVDAIMAACIVFAIAATVWVWRVPGAYSHFGPWIELFDPAVPLRKWASVSQQPRLREVYYLFCFPCYFLPAVSLMLHLCFPLKGRMAERFGVRKRLGMPILCSVVALISYGIAEAPMGDARGLHIASSNIHLIVLGWVRPCTCSVIFWAAG